MNPDIERLCRAAVAVVKAMTHEERERMFAQQRASWVRAEMSWPEPKFKYVNGVKVYESYEDYCNG